MYIGVFLGGLIGSYIPVMLFDAGWFSAASIILGFAGSAVGLWLGWKLTEWIDT